MLPIVYLGPNSTPSGDRLTSHSCEVTCHHCGNRGATFVEHQAGLITWIVCGSVCLVGCWLGKDFGMAAVYLSLSFLFSNATLSHCMTLCYRVLPNSFLR